jgi:SPP1 gp7 family putative phage head morphogenesis protein
MDKKRHVAIWLRMLATKEIATARLAKNLLKSQGTKITNAFKEGGQIAALRAVKQGQEDWVRILIGVYSHTILDFREYIQEQLGVRKSKSRYLDSAKAWVTANAYHKSKYITDTSEAFVKRVITDGLDNGLPEKEIAGNLQEYFVADSATSRARTIARTEVHNAASFGMQNGAEESELNLTREWVSVSDERSRDEHAEADGQPRGMDEPFDVGGEEVDYPGDGSPENSINCRCTLVYNQADTSFEGVSGDGDFSGDFEE